MESTEVIIDYAPREPQEFTHEALDTHRFVVAVMHRRAGKTVSAVNHLIRAAMLCTRPRPRFAYIGPTFRMAKQTAFDYLTSFSRPIPGVSVNVSELRVDYPNGGQVRLYGADNPDSLRGLYLDGAVLDEYGLMQSNVFSEVLRPALADREGWCLFIGTPNGKNQFSDIADYAKTAEGWAFLEFKASQTGIMSGAELASARTVMTADEYQQEFECSFEAAVKGAIYSDQLAQARADGRVTRVPYEPTLPVDTDWDLGVGDSTAIWFTQSLKSGEIRVIDFYESSGEGLPHYASVLKAKPYGYGQHWAPHDIQVREFTSGRSRLEAAASLGIRFMVQPKHPIEEGIHAARLLFPKCWFDADKCKAGLEALQHYRRDFNTRLNEFKSAPVHDWACVTGDTEVLTRYGTNQIQYLPEEGEVLTPCGWKAYRQPKITRRSAPLVAVAFSDGLTVKCTPDHLFLTVNGWSFASDLQTDSLIQSCWTPLRSTSMAASIASGLKSAIGRVVGSVFTGLSGLWPLVLSPRVAISTIGTMTPPIITSQIWSAWTGPNTSRKNGIARRQINPSTLLSPLGLRPLSGISPMPGVSGTAGQPSGQRVGQNGQGRSARVSTAGRWSIWSYARAGISRSIAQRRVRPLRIASVTALTGVADVWCLTVDDGHMWPLANGAMVHNSHAADAWRGLAVHHKVPETRTTRPAPPPPVSWLG